MIPSLLKNALLLRVTCIFRVISWMPLLKHAKFGTYKREASNTVIPPKEFIPGIAFLLLFVAELLEGWNAYGNDKAFLGLITNLGMIIDKLMTQPDLKSIGYFEKAALTVANVLDKKEILCFVHVYVMTVLLFGMSMIMSARWWKAGSRPTPAMVFVISMCLGGSYLQYSGIMHVELRKYTPIAGLVVREIANTRFITAHSNQAWYVVLQTMASLVTFYTIYQTLMKKMDKSGDIPTIESALLTVLVVSITSNICRLLRKQRWFILMFPVMCAGACTIVHHVVSAGDPEMVNARLRHLASISYAALCSMTILCGATTMFIPFFGLLQLMITMHKLDTEKLAALR